MISRSGTRCLVPGGSGRVACAPVPQPLSGAPPPSPRRSALVQEPDRPQRRRLHDGRERLTVPRLLDRLPPDEVADAGAAVALRVGVEDLPPATAAGQPDPVAGVRIAREVGDAGERL